MPKLAPKHRHVKGCVMPRLTRGYQPGIYCPDVQVHTLDRALRNRWDYDAHISTYAPPFGKTTHRLRKGNIDEWTDLHGQPHWHSIFIDLDRHDIKGQEYLIAEWWSESLELCHKLRLPYPDWYRTRNGGRLLWRLSNTITNGRLYERVLAGVIHECLRVGLDVDTAPSTCTTLWRLPKATKDPTIGPEDHPMSLEGAEWEPELLPFYEDKDKTLPRRWSLSGGRAEPGNETQYQDSVNRSDQQRISVTYKGIPALLKALDCGVVQSHDPTKLHCRCPWHRYHGTADLLAKGNGLNSSTALIKGSDGAYFFVCLHHHSLAPPHLKGPKSNRDLREHFPNQWDAETSPEMAADSDMPTEPEPETHTPTDLPAARAALFNHMKDALSSAATDHFVVAGLGVGKTYTACLAIAAHLKDCIENNVKKHLGIAVPTRDLRDEVARMLQDVLEEQDIYVPVHRRTGRDPEHCKSHAEFHAIRDKAGPETAREFCKSCIHHNDCPALRRMRNAGANRQKDLRVTIVTHEALLCNDNQNIDPFDVLIVDERPEVTPTHSLDTNQLAQAAARGHITGHERLLQLLDSSEEEGNHGAIGQCLTDAINKLSINLDAIKAHAQRHLGNCSPASILALAQTLSPLSLWLVLQNPEHGAYVYKGRLHASPKAPRAFAAPKRIYLDGTPTKTPGVAPENLLVLGAALDAAVDLHVIWYPINTSKRAQWRNPRPAATIHRYWDGPNVLHMDHKDIVERGHLLGKHNWPAEMIGPLDYHRSSTCRGSNVYKNATHIVISDAPIPKVALAALAEQLGCQELAQYQAIDAQIEQEIGRIRPHMGTRIVVWIGTRLPPALSKVAKSITKRDWREDHYELTGEALGSPGFHAKLQAQRKDGPVKLEYGAKDYHRCYDYHRRGPAGLAQKLGCQLVSVSWILRRTNPNSYVRRMAHWLPGANDSTGETLAHVTTQLRRDDRVQWFRLYIDGKPISERLYTPSWAIAIATKQLVTAGANVTTENISSVLGVTQRSVQRQLEWAKLDVEALRLIVKARVRLPFRSSVKGAANAQPPVAATGLWLTIPSRGPPTHAP